MESAKKQVAIDALNRIMELELAGVVKYTHYSLMVYGYNRIPIVSWLKGNAEEGLGHAHKAGELVTLLGGHPSLKIGTKLATHPRTTPHTNPGIIITGTNITSHKVSSGRHSSGYPPKKPKPLYPSHGMTDSRLADAEQLPSCDSSRLRRTVSR